jgi:hypothetical protein
LTSVRILVVGRRLAEGVSGNGSMVADPVMGCGWSRLCRPGTLTPLMLCASR